MKLKKEDKVKVLAGKDGGKVGVIEKIFPKTATAQVAGVNIYKKHQKAQPAKPGGIIEVLKPVPLSSLVLVCPKCEKATRVGFKLVGAGKFRVCKKCGEQI